MLDIESFEGGFDRNFDYLIYCSSTLRAALVDTATPLLSIREIIRSRDLILETILLTHTHLDHIEHLAEWVASYPGVQVFGHQSPVSPRLPNYAGLSDGTKVKLGNSRLEMIATPGHSPDSVCWYEEQARVVFTGDTVFVGRTGRTTSPQSDIHSLYRSVYKRILVLPKETVVHPGHNYGVSPTQQIGELENASAFFRCQNATQFVQVMAEFEATRQQ
jgi:glyoxylase-like metal-dependent hydrolase (beta-lactamase superfamily II)